MIPMSAPTFGARAVMAAAGTSARADRVRGTARFYEAQELDYIARAGMVQLWEMPRPFPGSTTSSQEDATWVYDARMVPKKGSARYLYNALKSAAPRGKCVACGKREASTLDHVLPKSQYPDLAFTPANLVPVCNACNTTKLAYVATAAANQPLHPYFDRVDSPFWLLGELVEEPTAPIRFRVQRLVTWNDEFHERFVLHFETYGLANLYAQDVADMLGNYRYQLGQELERSGSDAVRTFLREMADSYESAGAEPWSVVALRAWAESDWFCAGGWAVETHPAMAAA